MITVNFTGDSVTDCSRGRPVGEDTTLGGSYVSNIYVQTYAKNINAGIKVLNTATSGNTTKTLRERWETEVIAYPSDYLFIMIGINDCWRDYDSLYDKGDRVSVEDYKNNMTYFIESAKKKGIEPVLISPYYVDLNKKAVMRAKCDKLNAVLKELAGKYGLEYIDVQAVFDKFLKTASSEYLYSGDRVHPNALGKQVIADTILSSKIWKRITSK